MVLQDRQPDFGLVSDKFELMTETTHGEWKIEVNIAGKKYTTGFKVAEYGTYGRDRFWWRDVHVIELALFSQFYRSSKL